MKGGASGHGTSFSGSGKVTTNFDSASQDTATAPAIQSNGKIVVAGRTSANGRNDFALARYLSNGTTGAFINVFTPGGPPIDSAFCGIVFGANGHLYTGHVHQSKRLVALTW